VRTGNRARAIVSAVVATVGIGLVGTSNAVQAATAADAVGRQSDGSVRTPQGQTLAPAGRQVELGGRPVAVALRPEGATAVVMAASTGESLRVLDLATGTVLQSVTGAGSSYSGLAYSPDGSTLYSSDDTGKLNMTPVGVDGRLGTRVAITIPPANSGSNPVPTGIAVSADSKTVYVALSRDNAVGVVDVATRTLLRRIPVGNAPHSVVRVGNALFVSNEGGRPAAVGDFTNDSAGTPIVADAFGGGSITGTVSVVDAVAGTVDATVPVGLHPTAMTSDDGFLFVANTNDDTVSVLDETTHAVVNTIAITPFTGAPLGSQPTGLAVAGDRLFVTLGNNNAVAVYQLQTPTATPSFEGLVPTASYPAGIALDADRGQLVVPNLRGVGSVADSDAGRSARGVGGEVGSVSLIPTPSKADVFVSTRQVATNNGWDTMDTACGRVGIPARAIPEHVGEPSTIKHVVYIIKENRTYDQVLGDIGKGDSDSSLTQFGRSVTPNQHALADQFTLFDNFYDSGRRSNDGHNWAVQANSPDYLEKGVNTRRTNVAPPSGGTPPSSGFDALLYTPAGFLWENALRHGETFQDFGEYTREEFAPPAQSDIPSLDAHVVRDFPGFNLQYPDVQRADVFMRELAGHEARQDLPALTLMTLSNDHTGGSDPLYPTAESQVADNDLATGRIVDALSKSSFWPETAVFVAEDDAQGGSDHVDGHRSPFFLASPYAKRGAVDSTAYNQINVVRTIEQILGLPPMNQFDLAATPMRSAFVDTPDLRPFTASANQVPVDTPNPPLASQTGLQAEWTQAMMREDLTHLDAANEQLLNRNVWYETKGYTVPYPGDTRVLHPSEVPASTRGQIRSSGPTLVAPPSGTAARSGEAEDLGALTAAPSRSAAFSCGPPPDVPETRYPLLFAGVAALLLAGWTVRRRRTAGT
jgi:YVTN family beta-propeller protein